MSSLHESHTSQKPVENIQPVNLPEESKNPTAVAKALHTLVEHSTKHSNVQDTIHAPMHKLASIPFVQKLVPGIENVAAQYHVGNYVQMRGSSERFFESMPLYPRLGMHLLFYGGAQVKVLHNQTVESVLKDLSIKQGHAYDSPESVKNIQSFIDTYGIQIDDLLEPDITKYNSFNEFFYRQLKPGARPIQNGDDPKGICSAADSRLTVYNTIDLAKQFWIKGSKFTIPNLLNVSPDSEIAKTFEGGSLASFRLAPADYHRFHSPIDATTGEIVNVPGQYYTVNPQAVNESGFDVFTDNKRSILHLTHTPTGKPVAFVAIGAMLVGSIVWTGGATKGTTVKRGEELGYFAYGGSTVIAIFPKGFMEFDADLVENSQKPIETLVKVGYSVGKIVA